MIPVEFPTYYPVKESLFDPEGRCKTCGAQGTEIAGLDIVCSQCPPQGLAALYKDVMDYEPNRLTVAWREFVSEVHTKMMDGYFKKGRTGWDDADWIDGHIKEVLHEHIEKGDPRDVAILAMFWWYRLNSQQ